MPAVVVDLTNKLVTIVKQTPIVLVVAAAVVVVAVVAAAAVQYMIIAGSSTSLEWSMHGARGSRGERQLGALQVQCFCHLRAEVPPVVRSGMLHRPHTTGQRLNGRGNGAMWRRTLFVHVLTALTVVDFRAPLNRTCKRERERTR